MLESNSSCDHIPGEFSIVANIADREIEIFLLNILTFQ